jgi:Zn-dependent protease with chaperone function
VTALHGSYFDGSGSRRVAAELRVQDDQVSVVTDADVLAGPLSLDELSVPSRLGNTPRMLRFPDGAVFETRDNDAVDALFGSPAGAGLLHRLESRLVWVLASLVIVVIAVFGMVTQGVPALAKAAAHALPVEVERSLDDGMLEILDQQFFQPSTLTQPEQDRLHAAFAPIVERHGDGHHIQVLFRDAEKTLGPNAIAMPSGTIVFTDQLVRQAERDEELLAILAHEIGHVVHRHGLRQTLQGSLLAIAAALVVGDVSSVSSLVVALPMMLTQLGYSRDFEREADAHAVAILRREGIDVRHFAAALERLERACDGNDDGDDCAHADGVPGYLSTHPPTPERLRMIREALASQ